MSRCGIILGSAAGLAAALLVLGGCGTPGYVDEDGVYGPAVYPAGFYYHPWYGSDAVIVNAPYERYRGPGPAHPGSGPSMPHIPNAPRPSGGGFHAASGGGGGRSAPSGGGGQRR